MTRIEQSQGWAEWMQGVLASDEDLLAEVLRLGLQALMPSVLTRPIRRPPPRATSAV